MLLLSLLLTGCSDPPPDPPTVATCPPTPPAAGEVRVRQLACEADLPTGDFVAARVGDWVLENAVSRWVIRDGTEGHALLGLGGGNLVDAVRMDGGEQVGEDGLREYGTAVGFHVLEPEAFEAGEGTLDVRGELVPFPLITDILDVPEPDATVRYTYVLAPDEPILQMQVHLEGDEAPVDDVLLLRGGHRLHIPGADPYDLPLVNDASRIGVFTSDPGLGPALATDADVARNLLYAGPIRVVLYDEVEGTVTRRVALGADHAEASGWLDPSLERWSNDQGLVEVRGAAGQVLSRCRSASCPVPEDAAELVPIWIGDGNGGPGGPGQEGEPGRLRITASVPYRASAFSGELERHFLDGDGDGTFLVPPGTWDVHVTAGPTHTVHQEDVTVAAGEEVRLDASTLRQVVDTTGWSAADLHVHMETSLDSDITTDHRLLGALVEGLDYVVITDHDFVADPVAPEGLALRAAAEVSTMQAGHFNAWPVQGDAAVSGNGAPDWRGLDVESLVDALPGLVQCNHPRFVDGGYAASFEVGLAPERCDLVEVLNGYSPDETPVVLDDLLGAWSRGHRPVPTGASDSHEQGDFVGNPRTWIHGEGDADALDDALAGGRAVASGGPFVTLTLSDGGTSAGVGETLAPTGPVTATVDLQAPDWMPLAELALVVDGSVVWTEDLSGLPDEDGLKRRRVELEVTPSRYVMVLHRGAPARFPMTHAPPDVVSNPVWVE